jgi:choline dehydrogenase-like flavoprotein
MIEDFRQRDGTADIVTDICIIGAGAAGITLALSLADSDLSCCMVESGGMNFDSGIQSLGEVEQTHTDDGYVCHLRYFGGATNHWGGWCAPLNTLDFEPRPWVPDSGWPIRKEELDPYYRAAQAICGLGPFAYDTDDLPDDSRDYRLFNDGKLTTRLYQFSSPPKRFGTAYEATLRNAANIRVLLHANITHLETNRDASAVKAARIRTPGGTSGRIVAKRFVIACGGIQNARLLLLSNETEKRGLGNSNDLVGRHFMQHPHAPCASLVTADREAVTHLFDSFRNDGFTFRASLGPSAAQQREHNILNSSATLDRSPDPVSGYGALRHIWHDMKRGEWPDELGKKLWSVISDLDSLTTAPQLMTLYMRSEQSPNPDSRVMLGKSHDQLGLLKARVDWRLTDLDKRTVYTASRLIGEELARLNVGRVKLPDWLTARDANWSQELWGGCHLMGTTRMSDSPGTGVVDADCRMHTVGNVFIAGSSVFPTSGYANPTLTIVALSLRLADHLKTLND